MPETDAIEPGNTWSYAEKQFAIAFNKLLSRQSRILTKLEAIMAKLDDDLDAILSKVTEEDTKIDSAIALLVALKAKVDEIVAPTITPEQQAKLDAIFAAVGDNPERLQAAIDANTPAT